jgi:predicted DNA-binding protein YlxM (UPF0122 family)
MLEDGMSITAIAEQLGKSRPAIYNCLAREGVTLAEVL